MTNRSESAGDLERNGSHEVVLTEAEAWALVRDRDRRFDGVFVYAVRTTGIYCRPSCPARRPFREHVAYFASPQEAEEAGFRACRRCRPRDAAGTPGEQAVEEARAYLEAHLDEQVTLERLAEVVGLSPHHLQRTFKRRLGLSPREYQNARRMETFKEEVGPSQNVLQATLEAGFGSSRALYEQSEASLGMTPGRYRRRGDGLEIRYTIVSSRFGHVLVAATPRGVCAVYVGETEDVLEAELREEFSNASLIERDDEAARSWAEPIVRYLEGRHAHPSVPLDVQGTDFQRRVWHVLQKIPYGETRTYGQIAEALGQPTAARAVAGACASNNVALVVPCHRVVRTDGRPGGYRWGTELKANLLQHEQRRSMGVAPDGAGEGLNLFGSAEERGATRD